MNGLHLLIQVVLALAFFHLLLNSPADAFFNLKQINLRLHQAHQMFKTLGQIGNLQHILLLLKIEAHMRGDSIGQAVGIFYATDGGDHL